MGAVLLASVGICCAPAKEMYRSAADSRHKPPYNQQDTTRDRSRTTRVL